MPATESRKPQGYGSTLTITTTSVASPPSESEESGGEPAQSTRWAPVMTMLALLFVANIGATMAQAPQTRLYEDIVCRKHFSSAQQSTPPGGPTEDMCKIPEVQDVVAKLFGWQVFFEGIPQLLLAMYFGALADKIGRRPVITLSLFGQLLGQSWILFVCWFELPLELVWFSGLFLAIGGGGTVTSAASMLVLTDATTESTRAALFFQGSTAVIVAGLIGPAVSSLTMKTSLWIPLLLALGCATVATILPTLVSETMPPKLEDSSDEEPSSPSAFAAVTENLKASWRHTSVVLKYISHRKNVMLLVLTFLVVDYARQSLNILLQYVSTRYSVSISDANLLLSFKSICQLATCAILLPALDTFLIKRLKVAPKVKDIRLARLSLGLLTLSFAILVLAPSIWLVIFAMVFYTLGSGVGSFARSLVSSLVEPHMIGTLYTSLAVMDTIGSLLAGPLVAGTFSWSMKYSGIWRGIPFIFSFAFCGLATFGLMKVRLDKSQPSASVADEEERNALLDERS